MSEPITTTGPGDLLAAIHHAEGQIAAVQGVLVLLNEQMATHVNRLEELHEALCHALGNGVSGRRPRRRKKGEGVKP